MNWNDSFAFRTPNEVIFGVGVSRQVGEKARALGAAAVMVLCDPGVARAGNIEGIVASLEAAGVRADVWANVEPEPSAPTVQQAIDFAKAGGYKVLVAVGGGSSIDTAKGVATAITNDAPIMAFMTGTPITRPILPIIALPTTSGTGSECTNSAVITNVETNFKGGIGGPFVMARVALVDPVLASTMPPRVTANTGMDALVHAIEAYTNSAYNPLIDKIALGAIETVGRWLRPAYAKGSNMEARTNMAFASMTAGMAICNKGVGDAHSFAGPLATYLKQPHGVCVSVLIPHIMEWNALACPDKMANIAEALGEDVSELSLRDAADVAVDAVHTLMADLSMPGTLSEMGCTDEKLPTIVDRAFHRGDRTRQTRPMTMPDVDALMHSIY